MATADEENGFKKLKVLCCSFAEMGHAMPMVNMADALNVRGHDVHFLSNDDNYAGNKVSKALDAVGIKH